MNSDTPLATPDSRRHALHSVGAARRVGAMVALAFLVVAPRAFDAAADPPDYAVYGTSWHDEGFWNYPSAWAAVTGRWPDVPPPMHQMVPLYSLVQRYVFVAAGTGLVIARSASIVAGIVACLGVWSAFRRLGTPWQVCAAMMYATDFWIVAVDRLAAPEAISVCCLVWAIRCLVDAKASGRSAAAGGALALTGVLFKPVAAFFLPVAAIALAGRSFRHLRPSIMAGLLAIAGAVLSVGFRMSHGGMPPIVFYLERVYHAAAAEGGSPALRYLGSLHSELVGYEFVVHHTVPLVGIILGLAAGNTRASSPLGRLCLMWLLFWWLLIPFTGFRPFRYAYVSTPVTILGVLGFRRWMNGGAAIRLSPAALIMTIWLAAMWSMWLSDQTGIRARLWLPLIAAGGAAVWNYRATRGSARERVSFAAGPIVVGLVAVMTQAAPFTHWLLQRTHLVVEAERRVAAVSFDGFVCGLEAPNLLLSRPTNGPALASNYVWNPACRVDGRLAAYAVVPDATECTTYEGPFVRENYFALIQLPQVIAVELPPWRGSGSARCRYAIVKLRGTTNQVESTDAVKGKPRDGVAVYKVDRPASAAVARAGIRQCYGEGIDGFLRDTYGYDIREFGATEIRVRDLGSEVPERFTLPILLSCGDVNGSWRKCIRSYFGGRDAVGTKPS